MTDAELQALAALVLAQALQHHAFDMPRIKDGLGAYWGDQTVTGQSELEAELKRRGVLK